MLSVLIYFGIGSLVYLINLSLDKAAYNHIKPERAEILRKMLADMIPEKKEEIMAIDLTPRFNLTRLLKSMVIWPLTIVKFLFITYTFFKK